LVSFHPAVRPDLHVLFPTSRTLLAGPSRGHYKSTQQIYNLPVRSQFSIQRRYHLNSIKDLLHLHQTPIPFRLEAQKSESHGLGQTSQITMLVSLFRLLLPLVAAAALRRGLGSKACEKINESCNDPGDSVCCQGDIYVQCSVDKVIVFGVCGADQNCGEQVNFANPCSNP
jgi:hypothetical protein